MIKVLERREIRRYKIKCNKCKSLLEYDCTDAFSEHHVGCYGSYDNYYIKCPVCNNEVSIEKPTT